MARGPGGPADIKSRGLPAGSLAGGARQRLALWKCCACWRPSQSDSDSGSSLGVPSVKDRQRFESEIAAIKRDVESLQARCAHVDKSVLASRTRIDVALKQKADVVVKLRTTKLANASLCDKIATESVAEASRLNQVSALVADRRKQLVRVETKIVTDCSHVAQNWREGSDRLLRCLRTECERLCSQQAERERLSKCCVEEMRTLRVTSAALLELGTQESCNIDAVRSQNDNLFKEVEHMLEELEALHEQYWKGAQGPCRVARQKWCSLRQRVAVSDREARSLEKDLDIARIAVEVAANEAAVADEKMALRRALSEANTDDWALGTDGSRDSKLGNDPLCDDSAGALPALAVQQPTSEALCWELGSSLPTSCAPWSTIAREGVTGASGVFSSSQLSALPRLRAATEEALCFEADWMQPAAPPCGAHQDQIGSLVTPCSADTDEAVPASILEEKTPSASMGTCTDPVFVGAWKHGDGYDEAVDDATLQRELMNALQSLTSVEEEEELAEVTAWNDRIRQEIAEVHERVEQRKLMEEIAVLRDSLTAVAPSLFEAKTRAGLSLAASLSVWTPLVDPPPVAGAVPLPSLLAPVPQSAVRAKVLCGQRVQALQPSASQVHAASLRTELPEIPPTLVSACASRNASPRQLPVPPRHP
eukprot:TRINITY_DN16845_c0_g1_i1.p1 TRINITY_DN16845_c0_g1~~TRINITY_DN16845_c0_g1_i1.p1  ORF type:complete len:652 (+),score=116.32 TRINITY_DN16845_c0_g1_i1:182-2137(+)